MSVKKQVKLGIPDYITVETEERKQVLVPDGAEIHLEDITVKLKVNKIAARWPAKAVAQLFTFSKKGSDRIVPR